MKSIRSQFLSWLFVGGWLAACTAAQITSAAPTPPGSNLANATVENATQTPESTPSPTPTLAPTAFSTSTSVADLKTEVCSPLAEISLAELPEILSNPFQQPRPGIDDGHPGDDFAYWRRGDRKTMRGLPVYTVLPGEVAGLTLDRRPYGNMLVIESLLDHLPQEIISSLPAPQPTLTPSDIRLTCPAAPFETGADPTRRSLYLLYAHLNQAPLAQPGDTLTCGQQIGEVGSSGASVNDHLHLEVRVGPSGARFTSMAHYDASATLEETAAYCAWRVSGLFQPVEPLQFIQSLATQSHLQP